MRTALLVLLAATGGGRETIGVFHGWGAFRDTAPARCFAIARPAVASARGGFASVATWPGRARGSLYLRLSRPRAGSAVTLSIGDRRFVLAGQGADAWTTDAASDRAVVDAMRSGRSMSVEAVSAAGVPFADVYALAGAPTAIDAAALACAGRGKRR